MFGMLHNFNETGGSCTANSDSNNACEIGSGSTIMSYHGNCPAEQNIADNCFEVQDASGYMISCYFKATVHDGRETCPEHLHITGVNQSGGYPAARGITSNGMAPGGNTITFKMGNGIKLQPGFEVNPGVY